jgi:hypothetical protein
MIHDKRTDKIILKEINDLCKKGEPLSMQQAGIIKQAGKSFKEKDLQKVCKAIFESKMLACDIKGMFVMIGNENNQKYMSMGLVAGFPDAMILVNGYCFFVEFKRMKTGKISDKQKITHNKISRSGFDVYIIDDYQVFKSVLNEISRKI